MRGGVRKYKKNAPKILDTRGVLTFYTQLILVRSPMRELRVGRGGRSQSLLLGLHHDCTTTTHVDGVTILAFQVGVGRKGCIHGGRQHCPVQAADPARRFLGPYHVMHNS